MLLRGSSRSACGGLRQHVVVDGRRNLVSDEPAVLGGTDAGPTPHELIPAALAACVAITLQDYAAKRCWDPSGLAVDILLKREEGEARFDVEVQLPDGLPAWQSRRLVAVASQCPVIKTLESSSTFREAVFEV